MTKYYDVTDSLACRRERLTAEWFASWHWDEYRWLNADSEVSVVIVEPCRNWQLESSVCTIVTFVAIRIMPLEYVIDDSYTTGYALWAAQRHAPVAAATNAWP